MKLRNDIPVPDLVVLPGRPPAYPFRTMEVGSCFPVAEESLKSAKMAAWRQNRNGGDRQFLVAREGGKWYCWRVK